MCAAHGAWCILSGVSNTETGKAAAKFKAETRYGMVGTTLLLMAQSSYATHVPVCCANHGLAATAVLTSVLTAGAT